MYKFENSNQMKHLFHRKILHSHYALYKTNSDHCNCGTIPVMFQAKQYMECNFDDRY